MFNQATEMVYLADRVTDNLYARARGRGRWGQLWAKLTGRSRRLLALEELKTASSARARSQLGVRTVPIRQIRGSESRSQDFDCDFNPLQDHNKGRWLSVATAWRRGRMLPPVELIQVGDLYFVRDGHHRISVARAMGQLEIEAEVTVWRVAGRQSRETSRRESRYDVRRQRSLRDLLSGVGAHVRARLAPG